MGVEFIVSPPKRLSIDEIGIYRGYDVGSRFDICKGYGSGEWMRSGDSFTVFKLK